MPAPAGWKGRAQGRDSSGKNQRKGRRGSRRQGPVRATASNSVWLKSGNDVKEERQRREDCGREATLEDPWAGDLSDRLTTALKWDKAPNEIAPPPQTLEQGPGGSLCSVTGTSFPTSDQSFGPTIILQSPSNLRFHDSMILLPSLINGAGSH